MLLGPLFFFSYTHVRPLLIVSFILLRVSCLFPLECFCTIDAKRLASFYKFLVKPPEQVGLSTLHKEIDYATEYGIKWGRKLRSHKKRNVGWKG